MTGAQLFVAIFMIIVVVGAMALVASLNHSDKSAKNSPYKEVDRGVYDHAEYASEGGKYGGEVTVVHFNDGRTCVVKGFYSIPFKRGDLVKVMENEWDSKLEIVGQTGTGKSNFDAKA